MLQEEYEQLNAKNIITTKEKMDLIRIKETPTPQTPIILENKRVLRLAEQLTRKLKIEENLMIYRKRKHEEEQHYVLKKNVRFDSELESIATGGES